MTQLIFFDTEFTDIEKFHSLETLSPPGLISIGLISTTRRTFYAELTDTYTNDMCSDFVVQNVLPLLNAKYRMFEAQCADKLARFIESFNDEVVLVSDNPSYDWAMLENLMQSRKSWPKNLRHNPLGIAFRDELAELKFKNALNGFWSCSSHKQHHAMTDAMALQYAYEKTCGRELLNTDDIIMV